MTDDYLEARDRLRETINRALATDESGNPLGGKLVPAGRIYLHRTPALDGARLRALREERQMTAEVLARRARLSARHVWRLEAGQRPNVAAVTLARIALALRVDLYYLLGLSDEPEPWKNKVRVDRAQTIPVDDGDEEE